MIIHVPSFILDHLSVLLQTYDIDIRDHKQPLLLSRPKKSEVRARGGDDSPLMLIPELCTRTGRGVCFWGGGGGGYIHVGCYICAWSYRLIDCSLSLSLSLSLSPPLSRIE